MARLTEGQDQRDHRPSALHHPEGGPDPGASPRARCGNRGATPSWWRGAASTRGCTSCSSRRRAVTVGRGKRKPAAERFQRAVYRLVAEIPARPGGDVWSARGHPRLAARGARGGLCDAALSAGTAVAAGGQRERGNQPARQCRQHADAAALARAGRRAGAPRAHPARPASLDGTTGVTAARAHGPQPALIGRLRCDLD